MPPLHAIAVVAVVFCTACSVLMPSADRPTTGAPKTGERLAVVDGVKTWLQRDKVGEIRVENDAGQRLARADVYATQRHAKAVWYPLQGNAAIADEDFFRIAGDTKSYEATLALRKRNVRWNRVGRTTMLGGIAAVLCVALVDSRAAKGVLTIGGATAVFGGWYLMRWTHTEQQPENHAVDRADALRAAERYNRAHGLSLSKSF
jgi:hypothetical protein